MKRGWVFLLVSFSLVAMVLAHGGESEDAIEKEGSFFEDFLPLSFIILILIISAVPFLILAFYQKNITKQHILFWILIYLVSVITLIVVFDTVNLVLSSDTKGPVHWHADFEIWNCGERLNLIDPNGMANRVGTRVVHEHGDNRVHIEGILKEIGNADLHNFFKVIGGTLTRTSFTFPTVNGEVNVVDGDLCNNETAEVQIFLYKITNAEHGQRSGYLVEQLKINEDYILSPFQDVPPGDCIIIEFDRRKEKTDKICDTYSIAFEQGAMVMV